MKQLLFFGNKFCPPCKTMKERVQDWCVTNGVEFYEFTITDVFGGHAMAKQYGVKVAPTVVFVDGDEKARIEGLVGDVTIAERFNRFVIKLEKPKKDKAAKVAKVEEVKDSE